MTEAEQRAAFAAQIGSTVDPEIKNKISEQEDESALRGALATGGGGGGGNNVSSAAAASRSLRDDLGVTYREGTGGSMELAKPVDPRSRFTEAEAKQYLAGEKEITLPGSGKVQKFSPRQSVSPIQLPENKSMRLLTNADLKTLAESNTLPKFLKDGRTQPVLVSRFKAAKDPFEREAVLRDAVKFEKRSREFVENRDAFIQHEKFAQIGTPIGIAGGLAVGAYVGGATAIGSVLAGIGPFIAYLGEIGVPLVKLAGGSAIAKLIWEKIASEPQMTEEEAQKLIRDEVAEQLQKQNNVTADSGG